MPINSAITARCLVVSSAWSYRIACSEPSHKTCAKSKNENYSDINSGASFIQMTATFSFFVCVCIVTSFQPFPLPISLHDAIESKNTMAHIPYFEHFCHRQKECLGKRLPITGGAVSVHDRSTVPGTSQTEQHRLGPQTSLRAISDLGLDDLGVRSNIPHPLSRGVTSCYVGSPGAIEHLEVRTYS